MKIGLIGIGGMGGVHFGVYKKMEGITLSVADVRVDMARDKIGDHPAKLYSSIEELVKNEQPDIVDICTPSYMHADMAAFALEAGCNVLCEKPMSISTAETKRIIEAAEKSGKLFMTAHVVRFMSPYIYLKSVIDSGELGKPVHIIMHRLSEAPKWSWENWMLDEAKSGGAPIDLSIHDIDFVNYTFGRPKSISASHKRLSDNNDYILSSLVYDGFSVDIVGAWYNAPVPFDASYHAVFENGYVTSRGGVITKNGEAVEIAKGESSEDTGINLSGADGYADEIAYFIDCVKNGRSPDRVTPHSSEDSVRLVEELVSCAEEI